MVKKKVKVVNATGLQMQSAGVFCQKANEFASKITFNYGKNNTANAKSVLSVLGAAIKLGDEIEISCEGEDEEDALKQMVKIVEDGFQG
ncbi:MAG: HPr family phosphocarrier protein [Lachnospiraceae bacterium]|nr:HPr family phosphocarrier protein [Lachnospiraceae bacterium]